MSRTKKVALTEANATKKNITIKNANNNISHRMIRVKRKLLELTFRMVISAMASAAVASWVIPAAYAERGYSAVGGEWLLIVLTFVAVLYFTEVDNR